RRSISFMTSGVPFWPSKLEKRFCSKKKRCLKKPSSSESRWWRSPKGRKAPMLADGKIPVAVVGVGYLGKYHAEKYAESEKAQLVALVDADPAKAQELAEKFHVEATQDYRGLFGRVQCVSIAVPTRLHHDIAREFLEQGIDVLVEKPLAADISEGRDLVR